MMNDERRHEAIMMFTCIVIAAVVFGFMVGGMIERIERFEFIELPK